MEEIANLRARTTYTGYTSGITGNMSPGSCSAAYTVVGPDGTELVRDLMDTSIRGSGHDAEYLAVMLLCRVVTSRFAHVGNLSILCCDQLVVNQLSGTWRIGLKRFQTFVEKVSLDLKGVQWGITWIPRIANPIKTWHWDNYHQDNNTGQTLPDPTLDLQVLKTESPT